MKFSSKTSASFASDFFRVTVFAPGNVKVRSLELFGTRTRSEAIHMSRNILLEYLEQGHDAGVAELRGKGVTHYVYRQAGNNNLKESSRGDFIPELI